MANITAIEYGLITALVGVAAIAGVQGFNEHKENKPVATHIMCTAEKISDNYQVDLDCSNLNPALKVDLSTVDQRLAFTQALHHRVMRCDLFKDNPAVCTE